MKKSIHSKKIDKARNICYKWPKSDSARSLEK